jgi:aminopeptidase N
MWRAQLAGAREAIARTRAAEALAKLADPASVEALGRGLVQDQFWATRAACARALGQVRGEKALGHLLGRLGSEPHPKTRRALVRALGAFRLEAGAARAITELFERGDASYFVEGESLLALGRLRVPGALEVIRAGIETRRSYLEVIASQGVDGLGELGDRRALGFLLEQTAYGRPTRVRRAAVLALGRLSDLSDERGHLVDELCRLLDDPDFRLRMAVADALERAADPRAAGALQRALSRELDGRASRRYREVLRGLESGQAQGSALRRLRDEVSMLRDEQVRLRDRLASLEARFDAERAPPAPAAAAAAPPSSPGASK